MVNIHPQHRKGRKMFKTVTMLFLGCILASTVAFAPATASEDYIRCSDVAHLEKSMLSFAETRSRFETFSKGVCETAPSVCPHSRVTVTNLAELADVMEQLRSIANAICQ
jgi:hypothetical protein